jgi:hypothetical protein
VGDDMKKTLKILLGIVTIWPFLYMLIFFAFIIYMFMGMWRGGNIDEKMFWSIFPVHILAMLITMGLLTYYIVNLYGSNRINKDTKIIWAIVLFMGNMIAMPVYWYLYIWRESKVLLSETN